MRKRFTLRWIDILLFVLVLAPYARPAYVLQAQGIHHLKICTVPDSGDLLKIQCSDWNAALVVKTLSFGTMTAPPAAVDGDGWFEATNTPQGRTLAIKVKDNGVIRTLTSITF